MGVADKFQNFVSILRTTNHASVKLRYEAFTKRLNADFWGIDSNTKNSRYVGSYGRGTAINGFSDVDIMMQLPAQVYHQYNIHKWNGQSALLQAVKQSIAKTYSTTYLKGDGQVVAVNFTDGIAFEVVPAFLTTDGNYYYPDSNNNGSWRIMSPVAEIEAINQENRKYNNKVKHLVRMMKSWKNKNDVPMKGILLETLVMRFMNEWDQNDKSFLYYDYMTRDFLGYLTTCDKSQSSWAIRGSNRRVSRTGAFERKASISYKHAIEAIKYEEIGKENMANHYWKEVFGRQFKG